MESIPFVTIGIPLYNAEKFIANTINSILIQSYRDFELIITDDGSQDNSLEIIKSFDDSRIKLIADGKNKGISYRLNQQISLARGKYFVRMDADDLMFPDRIQKQIDFLEDNPDIEVLGSSVIVIDDYNKIIGFRKGVLLKDYEELFNKVLFNHPTVTGKLEYFKRYPYSEDLIGVEDADLWIRSFKESTFHVMEEPLLFYRDPLVFKLNTYLFRLKQKNKLLKQNNFLQNNKSLLYKLILKNWLRKILAQLLNFAKVDHIMITRRNKIDVTIDPQWKLILKQFTDE
ncbi:glycosyltransferase family 2 protein [Elizabethkingia ursingii]|uniref:glycosyltransferase family 2 protein n=1 Tax=Elizabethkingia ursingii TaxID=1756150 RepID=UPI0020124A0A|nr:glycosyltransferase [Elizabethkingia ursingii]MCL1671843.1 glycosyltransferase [Elizabethkingia ursingii]